MRKLRALLHELRPCGSVALHQPGRHTEFWRTISWHVGDDHADVICGIIDLYCWVAGIDTKKFHKPPPGR
jgi:hypothetical protein